MRLVLPIVKGLLRGDRRSLARAISIVDNEESSFELIIHQIFNKTGNARTVGFTGPGGAGKSSLISKLVTEFQNMGYRVAVLAVDPTSPITGGAMLGDRVRMQGMLEDDRVFMRSIASRGAIGGISRSVRNVTRILDAAGYNLILIESVGVGQVEIELSKVVNLTLVIFTPHIGDNIQAVKAGLNEIGDIYVINKGDLEGATRLYNLILDFVGTFGQNPAVMKVSAKTSTGITDLAVTVKKLLKQDDKLQKEKEKRMLELEIRDMVLNKIEQEVFALLDKDDQVYRLVDKLLKKEIDPYQAAEQLKDKLLR
jgi:LAO/AO transport system kinase